MARIDVLLCTLFALCLSVGQVLFKLAANHSANIPGGLVQKALTNPLLYTAFGWYALSSGLWYFILTRQPLTSAYIFSIAGAGLVPIFAWMVFREPITPRYAIGFCIMLAGFFIAVTAKPA